MAPRTLRVYFSNRRGYFRQNFNWMGGPITRNSVVHISISEAAPDREPSLFGPRPLIRWLGEARMTVHNVSPHDGGVEFSYTVDWPEPLNIAVDITVLDPPELVWDDAAGENITPRV